MMKLLTSFSSSFFLSFFSFSFLPGYLFILFCGGGGLLDLGTLYSARFLNFSMVFWSFNSWSFNFWSFGFRSFGFCGAGQPYMFCKFTL